MAIRRSLEAEGTSREEWRGYAKLLSRNACQLLSDIRTAGSRYSITLAQTERRPARTVCEQFSKFTIFDPADYRNAVSRSLSKRGGGLVSVPCPERPQWRITR